MEIRNNLNNSRMSFGSNAGKVLLKELDVPMGTLQYLGKTMIETGKLCDEKQLSPISEKLVAALDKFEKDVPAGNFDEQDKLIFVAINKTFIDILYGLTSAFYKTIESSKSIFDIEKCGKDYENINNLFISPMMDKYTSISRSHGGMGYY